MPIKDYIQTQYRACLNSYSQVFFSVNRVFSAILFLVSFIDPGTGSGGLLAVLITNVFATSLGFNRHETEKGLFGFNSLLVGLGLGYFFKPNPELYIIILIASVLTLFLVTLFKGILQKYGLPFLSLPFIFGIWIILLSTKYLGAIGISERGIFTLNNVYSLGGNNLVKFYETITNINLPSILALYFTSLGAIFFQFTILSGILIAVGLIIYSRIAFLLSMYGFFTAFFFYKILGGNINDLSYSYIGFNYILTAIALGGFFLIPSKKTFLWLILLIPIVALITLSLTGIFNIFGLSVYSLPFNIIVLLFLYALKFRYKNSPDLNEVVIQQYCPEKNLYSFHNQKLKVFHRNLVPFTLPFFGEWTVMQGHNGEHTHKEEWRFAWDFAIKDQKNLQYRNEGHELADYYCYDKTILSPADGIIEEVIDDIPDNEPGTVNTLKNWGNTIIIKHADNLYSSLNHLKKGSSIVKQGERVKVGQPLSKAGNSGRSPYPHLHFQLQSFPSTGSQTINYPISYFILSSENVQVLKSFEIPGHNDRVSNIHMNKLLKNAFNFIPGGEYTMKCKVNGLDTVETWSVNSNIHNVLYIFSQETNSYAYFVNDGYLFNFTHFEGNRNSLLYYFYLGSYNVLQGYYQDMQIEDEIPQNISFTGPLLYLHDFFAPFYTFLKSKYTLHYTGSADDVKQSEIKLHSSVKHYCFKTTIRTIEFDIIIDQKGIRSFTIVDKKKKIYVESN